MLMTFRCGHRWDINPETAAGARCLDCGDHVIARVREQAPRFIGHATGPHVQAAYLEPKAVSLAKVPLVLKEDT